MQICFKNEAYPAHHMFHLKTFCDDFVGRSLGRRGTRLYAQLLAFPLTLFVFLNFGIIDTNFPFTKNSSISLNTRNTRNSRGGGRKGN